MSNWAMYLVSSIVILLASAAVYMIKKTSIKNKLSGFQSEVYQLPYNVADPDTSYLMPNGLEEISGLSFLDTNQVLTINDEEAYLFKYDLTTENILAKIDFGKKGDYEGVARKGNLAYIIESNGNIKVVDLKQDKKIREYDTPLSGRNNVEGLCYDERHNQLLIACKGRLLKSIKNRRAKGIYSFNLNTNQFNESPFKLLELNEEKKLLKPLNLTSDRVNMLSVNSRLKSFSPSGIAINPMSLNIYILSAKGNILTVMDSSSKSILGIYFLSRQLYGQPEGICFNRQGDLYISNEAKSTKANIHKIKRMKDESSHLLRLQN